MHRNVRAIVLVMGLFTTGLASLPLVADAPQERVPPGGRTAQERGDQRGEAEPPQPQRDPEGSRTAQPRDGDREEARERDGRTARDRDGARTSAPRPARPVVVRRGHVFVGGYFYDPFFGPYPWWRPRAYPHWYLPVYDNRADVRLLVTPRHTVVYVDGFYAGIVDDFDGLFQRLPLPPGGHQIELYLEGYRTARRNVYLRPGSTMNVHHTMERLPAGERAERPPLAPPVPPPPPGTYRHPQTPPPAGVPLPSEAPATPAAAAGFGTIELQVQPVGADVKIDGNRWVSSDGSSFVVQVPAGMHRVDVSREEHRTYSADIEVREGETTPLNVSLISDRRP